MKTCIRLLCAVCCAAMLLTTTACSGGNKNTSSATAEATPAPEITPAPEATAAPEEEPTPAPEGNTSSETGENRHTSTLPVPETGSEEFRAAFENNPIDTQYADDMETAGSVAGMITACNTATAGKSRLIPSTRRFWSMATIKRSKPSKRSTPTGGTSKAPLCRTSAIPYRRMTPLGPSLWRRASWSITAQGPSTFAPYYTILTARWRSAKI